MPASVHYGKDGDVLAGNYEEHEIREVTHACPPDVLINDRELLWVALDRREADFDGPEKLVPEAGAA